MAGSLDRRASCVAWLWATLSATLGCGGEALAPEPAAEPQIARCYRLQAHELPQPGDDTPFRVESGDRHTCFFFDIPWPSGAQAVRIRSLQGPLTHHWLLTETQAAEPDGEIVRNAPHCAIAPEKALAVYGRNQQQTLDMPSGYGLALPSPGTGRGLLLGVHHFNPGPPDHDGSGVEICTAEEPRPRVAGVVPVGPFAFSLPPGQETTIESVCTPRADEPIHILRSFPHMHERGIGFAATIERADGSLEPLLELTYDAWEQRVYDTPAVLRPGDRLRTTCRYFNASDRAIASGARAEDEMCINFVTASPPEALAGDKSFGGGDACTR